MSQSDSEVSGDHQFLAIVVISGHGRPSQLSREFSKTLDRALANEFGENARVTSLTKKAYNPSIDITDNED